jgi:hypothetical protein
MPPSIFVRLVFDNSRTKARHWQSCVGQDGAADKRRVSTLEPDAQARSCPDLYGQPEGLLEREPESAHRQRRVWLQ